VTSEADVARASVGTTVVRYDDLDLKVVKQVLIPMSDGIRLAADVYAPASFDFERSDPLPVAMEYTPYRKDDVGRPAADAWYAALPRHGYLFARVDCRGTGGSEGRASDEYSPREQKDGAETVEWLASQSWCNSRVAVVGGSYGGFTALQIAAQGPPHLAAIVPMLFTDDRYADDCHYVSGLLRMYHDAGFYGTFMVAFNAMPPDPVAASTSWADLWTKHLEENEPYLLTWLRQQKAGPYWENGSVGPIADRIRCPVFMIGGWHDGYVNPPFRLFQALTTPRRLLMGPGDHSGLDRAIPGPRIDYIPEVVGWLDQWCRSEPGDDPGRPPIVAFMERYSAPDPYLLEAPGEWRGETDWPPAGFRERALFLTGAGLADAADSSSAPDELSYDPSVGVTTGLFSAGIPFSLPDDHRRDEAFSVNYTSAELEDDVAILGRPTVVVHATSTARRSAIAATLCEVGPDGRSRMVTKGIARLDATPPPSEDGYFAVQELRVDLNAVGWCFTRGNRIRLSIANSDFPNVWPTPEPMTTRVLRGGETPSRLLLPEVPSAGSAPEPTFAPSPVVVSPESRTAVREWEIIDDVLSRSTRVACRFSIFQKDRRPAEFDFVARVNRERPAEASISGSFRMIRDVDGRSVSALATTVISSTLAAYHITITLSVTVGGADFFTRRWVESVPREA